MNIFPTDISRPFLAILIAVLSYTSPTICDENVTIEQRLHAIDKCGDKHHRTYLFSYKTTQPRAAQGIGGAFSLPPMTTTRSIHCKESILYAKRSLGKDGTPIHFCSEDIMEYYNQWLPGMSIGNQPKDLKSFLARHKFEKMAPQETIVSIDELRCREKMLLENMDAVRREVFDLISPE